MVTALALLGVLAVLFAAAVLSTREQDLLSPVGPDDADVALPAEPLTPQDVRGVRLSLAPRGYRMSQVDEVLERLAQELADRDRRIGLLEAAAEGASPVLAPAPVREASVADLPVEPALAAPPLTSGAPEATSSSEIAGTVTEPEPLPDPTPERVVETVHVPPTRTTLAWSNPAAVPEFPVIDAPEADVRREPLADPIPAADLGTDLVHGERREAADADVDEADRQQ